MFSFVICLHNAQHNEAVSADWGSHVLLGDNKVSKSNHNTYM